MYDCKDMGSVEAGGPAAAMAKATSEGHRFLINSTQKTLFLTFLSPEKIDPLSSVVSGM